MSAYFVLMWSGGSNIVCNIETVFKSSGKGFYWMACSSSRTVSLPYYSLCIGNISAWAECYDLEHIYAVYQNLGGELSSLSKLQKLNYVNLLTWVTGEQTDLYNNGANVTTFRKRILMTN